MRNSLLILAGITAFLLFANSTDLLYRGLEYSENVNENKYWLVLYRNKNVEYLYKGVPGDSTKSSLIRTFQVKTGTPGQSPTPLPSLMGKRYWTIINKYSSSENPETAPYFIELDIPNGNAEPFGPSPYLECNGQCTWRLPGEFGLHGINGDLAKLARDNSGSSGCVRHTDKDVTYLYDLLRIEDKTRYYVVDDVIPERFSRPLVTASKSVSIPMSSLALINMGE